MNKQSRILMAIASLLLIGAYLLPLWNISLEAPQYPEGLGLRIWINNIDGQNPHDLDKINNLNHYIGMKKIEPDSILELKYMPFIIGFMMLFGLFAAYLGKRSLVFTWVGLFIILGIAGLYDFYLWGYDYGHNLDAENAIIKVPGMSYQPPVIGRKQLLNFTAISLPGIGGYVVMISILLAAWTTLPWRKKKAGSEIVTNVSKTAILLSALLLLVACEPQPRDIRYNEDICAKCLMGIADSRFGAEMVTLNRKIYTFDSIECLAAFQLGEGEELHSLWVTNWLEPGRLLDATIAAYLHGEKVRSPMGMNLLAVASIVEAKDLQKKLGGDILDWTETQQLVGREW